MKNILLTIGIFILTLSSSCKKGITDFLDKPPGVDVTEDTIFSSKAQVETFLATTYYSGVAIHMNPNYFCYGEIAGACDEGEMGQDWHYTNLWNTADISANDIVGWGEDFIFYDRWSTVRRTNIIIERIDGVPGVDQAYKDQVKGEAKFIRALSYFEMLKRYGGVPIIDKRFNAGDDLNVTRSTVEDCVNFIVKDCDEAAGSLPSAYPANLTGRITRGAALMLKAKTLLYAASPLFNTGTPYLNFGSNNNLICYGNFDKARWQLAADAAKAVLDWAPTAGCSLITNQGVDKNYRYAWEHYDNSEIILAEKAQDNSDYWALPFGNLMPPSMYGSWGGITPTLNFLKFYEKKDGTPQTWNPSGGNDLNEKYAELDPRFAQSIAYNGSFWNEDYPIIQTFDGGNQAGFCVGGEWVHKLVPASFRGEASSGAIPNWILFHLAEAYVSYAEALNEAQGPVQEAYDALNIIRARSGMPPLPAGLSQDQFRVRARNERAVELAFEDQRFWDIRRWLIGENDGVMKGNMYGLKITAIPASNDFHYQPYVFEVRSFYPKEYLHPWPTSEINKGYFIQNPGW